MASPTRSSSRTPLAILLGVVGVVAIPAGVVYSRYSAAVSLIDAAWMIPVAAIASVGALVAVRRARRQVRFAASRPASLRLGRFLGVLGVCLATSATIAIAFYEVLLRLEG